MSGPKDSCTCTPCTSPGNGGPNPGHCAACCMQTGIIEYDLFCPVDEHRAWARKQWAPLEDYCPLCKCTFSEHTVLTEKLEGIMHKAIGWRCPERPKTDNGCPSNR